MKSMTGYGKGTKTVDGITIVVELKSVNHRFLDISLKLPKFLGFLDDVFRKAVQAEFSRGHLDIFMSFADLSERSSAVVVDRALAKKYVDAAKELAQEFGIENNFSVENLLKSPEVVKLTPEEADEKKIEQIALAALMDAVAALQAMRLREGEALKVDFLEKLADIEKGYKFVEGKAKEINASLVTKVEARIAAILGDVPVDPERLLNEAAFYCDRMAIDEELTRLKTHIEHARSLTEETEAVGRKFDFLIQEFNREINTIGSKCSDLTITQAVLQMKNAVEKMREQIQNIE